MNKTLLFCFFIFLLPVVSLAQDKNPPLFEDFAKGIKNYGAFVYNDQLNVMQLATDDDQFALVGINDKMKIVWKASLPGYNIAVDKFKDKIVVLASTAHTTVKGTNNTYKAFLIDPATGKLLADKVVYQSTDEFVEQPQMYTGDGAFFKLAVRRAAIKRQTHVVVFPFMGTGGLRRELNETKELRILTYNDQLDSTSSFKAAVSNGTFISLAWNKHADMFVSWLNGPSIEVYKYDAGQTTPSSQLTAPIELKANKYASPADLLFMQPAEDKNVLYYSLLYLNEDKDPELGTGKLDFASGKKSYVTQVVNKANLKALKKAFVPVNKDLDDVDFGYANGMSIKYITETAGKLITVISASSTASSSVNSAGVYFSENNMLINAYDKDLNLKFQQILPVAYTYTNHALYSGFRVDKNKLRIVANSKSILGVYGSLDINTGKWDKMEYLSKKHIGNHDFADGPSVLWFSNNYIVPYFEPKGMFTRSKYDLTLQQNEY